jgi:hypothetical protein
MGDYMNSPMVGGGTGKQRGRKSLNTSPPPAPSTFDWDGHRDGYWRRLDWQAVVERSTNLDAELHRLKLEGFEFSKPAPKPQREAKKPAWAGRPTKYDRDEMARRWILRETVKDIADALGCGERTVRECIRAKGVYDPERDKVRVPPTRPKDTYVRRKTCARGLHDMDVYGREVTGKRGADGQPKANGRYCSACQRIGQGADPSLYVTVDTADES